MGGGGLDSSQGSEQIYARQWPAVSPWVLRVLCIRVCNKTDSWSYGGICDMNIQDLRLRTLNLSGTPFLIESAYYCPTEFLHLAPWGKFWNRWTRWLLCLPGITLHPSSVYRFSNLFSHLDRTLIFCFCLSLYHLFWTEITTLSLCKNKTGSFLAYIIRSFWILHTWYGSMFQSS